MADFKPGSLVRLKSGSPILTADETRGDGVVIVMYWSGAQFVRETFLPDMLEEVGEDDCIPMSLADCLFTPEVGNG